MNYRLPFAVVFFVMLLCAVGCPSNARNKSNVPAAGMGRRVQDSDKVRESTGSEHASESVHIKLGAASVRDHATYSLLAVNASEKMSGDIEAAGAIAPLAFARARDGASILTVDMLVLYRQGSAVSEFIEPVWFGLQWTTQHWLLGLSSNGTLKPLYFFGERRRPDEIEARFPVGPHILDTGTIAGWDWVVIGLWADLRDIGESDSVVIRKEGVPTCPSNLAGGGVGRFNVIDLGVLK